MTFAWATNLAQQLLTKYGQVSKLHKLVAPTPNPTQPWKPGTPVPVDFDCVSASLGFQEGYDRYFPGYQSAGMTRDYLSGDVRVLVPLKTLAVDPDANDTFTRFDGLWQVIDAKLISPNGERIMADLHLRR